MSGVSPRLALESILFAAGEPVRLSDLSSLVELPRPEVKKLLAEIQASYVDRGIRLVIGEQEAQLVTAPETEAVVGRFLKQELRGRLSKGALETLAIRGLIGEVGRKQEPGRPILYDTTIGLLKHLGVGGKDELPAVPEELEERLAAATRPAAATQTTATKTEE